MINQEKLARLETLSLDEGKHTSFEAGHCAVEVLTWLTDEEHSDHAKCACPVIQGFVRRLNDRMPRNLRDELLRPEVPKMADTKGSRALEQRRRWVLVDTAVRVFVPLAMEAAKLPEQAVRLRNLPEVVDKKTATCARDALREARKVADAAADAAAYAANVAAANAAANAAYAAANAAYAADAAANAADAAGAAAARKKMFTLACALVARLCEMKEAA